MRDPKSTTLEHMFEEARDAWHAQSCVVAQKKGGGHAGRN